MSDSSNTVKQAFRDIMRATQPLEGKYDAWVVIAAFALAPGMLIEHNPEMSDEEKLAAIDSFLKFQADVTNSARERIRNSLVLKNAEPGGNA